mmetsp:Transcript_14123/g.50732  ORF Transcript_14123/g.50732 Transcript_14123/m.50732 type:complete len:231 (+) Transcript_14123:1392-2084(+)
MMCIGAVFSSYSVPIDSDASAERYTNAVPKKDMTATSGIVVVVTMVIMSSAFCKISAAWSKNSTATCNAFLLTNSTPTRNTAMSKSTAPRNGHAVSRCSPYVRRASTSFFATSSTASLDASGDAARHMHSPPNIVTATPPTHETIVNANASPSSTSASTYATTKEITMPSTMAYLAVSTSPMATLLTNRSRVFTRSDAILKAASIVACRVDAGCDCSAIFAGTHAWNAAE